MNPFLLLALLVCLMTTGCKTLAPEPAVQLPLELPGAYVFQADASGVESPGETAREWWLKMDRPELNALIEQGIEGNHNLKVLSARVDQARASLKKESAGLKPGLDYSFGGEKDYTRTQSGKNQGGTYANSHSWDASLSGSYPVDAWGQIKAQVRARDLTLEAAVRDLNDAVLELACDISKTWVDIISARKRKAILASQIQFNQTSLELLKLMFLNGKASALDVSQQRESLAQVLALEPLLEQEEALLLNELAFMTGTTPGRRLPVQASELPSPLMPENPGIPADLLENRADIQAARLRLLSSQSDVEAAKADILPSFTLTARAVFSSGRLEMLFHNWAASLGAAVAGSLLDGGEKKAEVERVRAEVKENLHLYAQTVAQAIREVEDALVTMDRQKAYITRLEEELSAARLTLGDARIQYLNGQSDYLSVLTARLAIEGLERQLVGERASLLNEEIGFYRALGSRWESGRVGK